MFCAVPSHWESFHSWRVFVGFRRKIIIIDWAVQARISCHYPWCTQGEIKSFSPVLFRNERLIQDERVFWSFKGAKPWATEMKCNMWSGSWIKIKWDSKKPSSLSCSLSSLSDGKHLLSVWILGPCCQETFIFKWYLPFALCLLLIRLHVLG